MGSMTFAQMRKAYLQGSGDSPAAQEEAYMHLTQGLRNIWGKVDLPESQGTDEDVTIPANNDRVLVSHINFNVFSLSSLLNITDNAPMYAEPNGVDGRRIYLTNSGLPPTGNATHWCRDGDYLFVRNMPTVDTTLRLHGRKQSPEITESNLNATSPLPAQYDMPTVWQSVISYMLIHDPPSGVSREDYAAKMQSLQTSVTEAMATAIDPRAQEDRTIRTTTRLRGYSTRPRSMRRG